MCTETVSTSPSICCDHPQMSGFVTGLCHHRLLQVFSAGMAYVALSRVESLSGMYLAAFDPKSIMVSVACLNKVAGYLSRLNNSTVATCVIL